MKKDFTLGFISQFLNYGASLITLPIVIIYLNNEEVGLWYIFLTIQGLAGLIDFGFQPTFSRSFSLAYSGVKSLKKEGIHSKSLGKPNYQLLSEIFKVSKTIYLILSIFVFVCLILFGSQYLEYLTKKESQISYEEISLAWYAFSIGLSINIYLMWISPFLIGNNVVYKNYVYIIINKSIFSISSITLLILDFGLLSLALSLIFGATTARFCMIFIYRKELKSIEPYKARKLNFKILNTIWPTVKRTGIVSISTFLINRYNLLVISTFFGLSASAVYGLTSQLLMSLSSISQLLFQINVPTMIRARVEDNNKKLWKIYKVASVYYFGIFILGSIIIYVLGVYILPLLNENISLLDKNLFFILAIILMLEGNHSNAGLVITTRNSVPFAKPAVISGFLIAILSTLSGYLNLGLAAVIASQGIIQLAYNNWKWPYVVIKEIRKEKI